MSAFSTVNYFELYDLPISFQLNTTELKRKYYERSRQFHPDFHTQAHTDDQDKMLEWSSLNNQAYKTLADPDQRMRYILELKGFLGDENKAPALPQDFLMEMMDVNEALMELEFDRDEKRYFQAKEEVQNIENQLDIEIKPFLNLEGEDALADEALKKIRDFYLKRRYLLRISENLHKFAPTSEQ